MLMNCHGALCCMLFFWCCKGFVVCFQCNVPLWCEFTAAKVIMSAVLQVAALLMKIDGGFNHRQPAGETGWNRN